MNYSMGFKEKEYRDEKKTQQRNSLNDHKEQMRSLLHKQRNMIATLNWFQTHQNKICRDIKLLFYIK